MVPKNHPMIQLFPRPVRTLVLPLGLVLLAGCGEDLRPKIAELEAQLAKEKELLYETSAKLAKETANFNASKAAFAKEKDSLVATVEKQRIALSAATSELEKQNLALSSSLTDLAKVKAKLDESESERARERFSLGLKLAELERAEVEKKAAAERVATLTVQIGLTMRSGETKAVTNEKVYLVRSRCSEILGGISPLNWGLGMRYPLVQGDLAKRASALVQSAAVATSVTDFNGSVVFENIPKGSYFVICATALGGGAVVEQEVVVSDSKSRIALSNNDIVN